MIKWDYKNKHNCIQEKYYFPYNEHVNEIQQLSVTQMQPFHQMYESVICLVILLSNLAHPQWVTVNCSKPMISDIVCVFEEKSREPTKYLPLQTEICPYQIKLNEQCFSLIPFSGSS